MVKKILILMCFLILLLTACGTSSKVSPRPNQTGAISENNQINDLHGNIENLSRMDMFVHNVSNHQSDEITITHYTIEGDPIYDKIQYNGDQLTITNDNTKDKFGSPQIITYTCSNITKQESEMKLEYLLVNCSSPDGNQGSHPVISINYNLAQQDYFAFRLEYGTDYQNVIDTKEQKLVEDQQNGHFISVADFQFSDKDMQQIYKLMVLAGYLGEKQLSNTCKADSNVRYKLKVWINQGEREFDWNQCDASVDGKQMTKLAEEIIEILKKTETYKSFEEMN